MAFDNTASQGRKRLTRTRSRTGLARDLLKTQSKLLGGPRFRAAGPPEPDIFEGMWDLLRSALDRIWSRSRSGSGGGGAAPGGGQEAGQGPQGQGGGEQAQGPPPEQRPVLTEESQALLQRMHRIEKRIGLLSDTERWAFEDTLLSELRKPKNATLVKAFQESRATMPLVWQSVANAQERESFRERPHDALRLEAQEKAMIVDAIQAADIKERQAATPRRQPSEENRQRWERQVPPPAPPRVPSPEPSPRPSFQDPRANEPLDAHSADAARRRSDATVSPSPGEEHDAHGFNVAETERALRASAAQLTPLQSVDHTGRTDWPLGAPVSSLPDEIGMAFSTPGDSTYPVSPLLSPTGLDIANDRSFLRSPSPTPTQSTGDGPSHAHSPKPVRQNSTSNGGQSKAVRGR
ncbi:hypothetical protein [Streptomyces sp. NRRL F-525]|uniref:hypothetical protein n=1 Tax=Streptomyces sp. NRRL F-525 TaxID=1463861 RepID=UPI0005255E1A|nr:hypothetical protein [Streptomyces sp. NRRL F-525]